jgi:hypothetical protein
MPTAYTIILRLSFDILHVWCRRMFTLSLTALLKKKLRGFSPQANYTDRATAVCRRS